jgi:DNA-directed RNA polymerase subunit omega
MPFDKPNRGDQFLPPFSALAIFDAMMSQLVEEASKKITSVPLLVNVVSKRVRQLNAGHKPMVDVIGRMGFADIALKEIIEGKLGFEQKQKEQDEA